jgi:hypothetical protein
MSTTTNPSPVTRSSPSGWDANHLDDLLTKVISMAYDFSIETRLRRLIESHWQAGDKPRTLVMNHETWKQLMWELDGRGFRYGLYWTPQPEGAVMDPSANISTYLGLPILIKDFLPNEEIIVGIAG